MSAEDDLLQLIHLSESSLTNHLEGVGECHLANEWHIIKSSLGELILSKGRICNVDLGQIAHVVTDCLAVLSIHRARDRDGLALEEIHPLHQLS